MTSKGEKNVLSSKNFWMALSAVLAVALAALVSALVIHHFSSKPKIVDPPQLPDLEIYNTEDQKYVLANWDESKFADLSDKDLDLLLNTTARNRCYFYGLPFYIEVQLKDDLDHNWSYDPSLARVYLSKEWVEENRNHPDEVLKVVLHNCAHIYQHQQVALLMDIQSNMHLLYTHAHLFPIEQTRAYKRELMEANEAICEKPATASLAEYDARKIAREQAQYINELIGSDFIEAESEELPYTEAIPVKEEIEPLELPSEPFTIDKNE